MTKSKQFVSFEDEYNTTINELKSLLNSDWELLDQSTWYHYGIQILSFKHKTKDLVVTYDLNLDTKEGMKDWYRKKTNMGLFFIHENNRFDYHGNWIPNPNIVNRYKTLNGIIKYTNK